MIIKNHIGGKKMNKYLKYVSIFVLFIAQIAANTPSQLGSYQPEVPCGLKK